jgi:hypothetical protein
VRAAAARPHDRWHASDISDDRDERHDDGGDAGSAASLAGPPVTELGPPPRDPTHTIHFLVGRTWARLVRDDEPFPNDDGDSMLAWQLNSNFPDYRWDAGLDVIAMAWLMFAGVSLALILVIAIPLDVVVGHNIGDPVSLVFLAGIFFCAAGALNVVWRTCWYVPKARRIARFGDNEAEAYTAAMWKTVPRNTSLVFQTAVFALVLVVGLR